MPALPTTITVRDLAAWRDEGGVRSRCWTCGSLGSWQICSLPDVIAIPLQQLPSAVAELPTDRPLVVMCHHGMRSQSAVNFLHENGVANAVNLDGGIAEWARLIDPAIRNY